MLKTYGKVAVSGIVGALTWTNQGTGSKAIETSREAVHSWTVAAVVRDPANGAKIGELVHDEQIEVTIEFVAGDSADPQNHSAAVGALLYPPINGVVTITGGPAFLGTSPATFNYVGGWAVSELPDGATRVRCTVRRMLDTAASSVAVLATEVTS